MDGSVRVAEGTGVATGPGATVVGMKDEAHMAGTYRLEGFTLTYESGNEKKDYTVFLLSEEPSASPKLIFADENTLMPVE